ncbi:hypothetical protein CsSME_00002361 [Camellia sinensis var. sinensis]
MYNKLVHIQEFMDVIKDYPLHSSGLVDASKVLTDIIESIIGAIYIDNNSSIDITVRIYRILHVILSQATLYHTMGLSSLIMWWRGVLGHGDKEYLDCGSLAML